MSSIEEILSGYGGANAVLSPGEREALDRDGYVVLPDIIDDDRLERLRTAFEGAYERAGHGGGVKESGTRQLNGLVNRSAVFELIYVHPRVLAAVYQVLRDEFRIGQVGGRDPLPGYGQQGLHADWTVRTKGEAYRIVTVICLLDDFTSDNGATRVVPGSHRQLKPPPKSFADPASRHPDQRVILAQAGSVLVLNGHLWHSGTMNRSGRSRRVVQCCYVGRDEVRLSRIKVDARECLTAAARYLLGV